MSNKRSTILSGFILILLIFCLAFFLIKLPTPLVSPTPSTAPTISMLPSVTSAVLNIGTRTKTTDCQVQGTFEDLACTPGAIIVDATVEQICTSGYSSQVRDVPESEKKAVYAEYGIQSHTTGQYEVDHLISLELGGSNDIANLWPEAAEPRPGFHEKDKVENYLHAQVCSGKMSLPEAQKEIVIGWLGVYQQIQQF